MSKVYKHPNSGDVYTPVTPELLSLFDRMHDEQRTWRRVAAISGTRMKVLRNVRSGKRKAISQTFLDRLCTTTGVGSIHEFTWFTPEDLVTMGIWDPVQYVEGNDRVKGPQRLVKGDPGVKRPKKKKVRVKPKGGIKAPKDWRVPR